MPLFPENYTLHMLANAITQTHKHSLIFGNQGYPNPHDTMKRRITKYCRFQKAELESSLNLPEVFTLKCLADFLA